MSDENKKKHDINSDLGALRSAAEALSSLFYDDKKLSLEMIELMQKKLIKIKERLENKK